MRTFVATSSVDKMRELRALFDGSVLSLENVVGYQSVPEDGETYMENALIKARALHRTLQMAGIDAYVLADDSGIEVEALGGRPGVHSARYAGEGATWDERLGLLLSEMQGVQNRRCRYVCFFAFIFPDGRELVVSGSVGGELLREASGGSGGFGYDPLFYYPPWKRTFAQMTDAEKNTVSHRHYAARNLLNLLPAYARHRSGN